VDVLSFALMQKKERKKKSSAKERLRPFARQARGVALDLMVFSLRKVEFMDRG